MQQVEDSEGKEKPKIEYEIGEMVKVNDGPFMNLSARSKRSTQIRVSSRYPYLFSGDYTPVELEYWQVQRTEES
jgi:transcriptional antiterminator NusG